MTKAYWIVHVKVHQAEAYQRYVERASQAIAKFSGVFLVRGGNQHVAEGQTQGERTVVIEFESMEQAIRCYHSDLYQKARSFRQAAAEFHCVIVEGHAECLAI